MLMQWGTPADLPTQEGYDRVPLTDAVMDDEDEAPVESAEAEQLREEVKQYLQTEKNLERQMNGLNGFWTAKAELLRLQTEECTEKRQLSQDRLLIIAHQHTFVDATGPPGLKSLPSLSWVLHPKFGYMCSCVVLVNIITMFMEMAAPHYKRDFFWLDQFVLVFYIGELVLKALIYRQDLLVGTCSIVWWNWLDLTIVLVGILDQWVQPLVVSFGPDDDGGSEPSTMVQVIKMLRIARLARILKTVRAFMQSDLSWTEGKSFQLFIMGTIAANSIIMSFESDFPDFAGWWYVEQVLLIIFSFELLVRLKFSGCRFFYDPRDIAWNWLDFTIVSGGVVDEWFMPALKLGQSLMGMKSTKTLDVGELMTTLRMARLLRILRLVRLVKNIPPLFTLIVGIIQAMQGMAWVLVLTAVFLYAFALLSVRLIGHGMLFGGQAPAEVAAIFPTVPQSMFVLFKVMNGDTDPVEPLFDALPISKLIFVLYMVVSSWAILSILTAVVSDNMINATDQHRLEIDGEEGTNEEQQTRQWLGDLFSSVEEEGNGYLSADKITSLLDDEAVANQLQKMTKLSKADLLEVYNLLRTTDKVASNDFIDAIRTEKKNPTERSVLRLEKRLINLQNAFDMEIGHLKASSRDVKPSSQLVDPQSVEAMFEPLFKRIAERLDIKGREVLEQLAVSGSCSNVGGTDKRYDSSVIQDSLARIEEQVELNTKLLDRSRVECTIVSCLSKIEKQNIDVKGALFDSCERDSAMRSFLGRIEKQSADIQKALADGCEVHSIMKSSLTQIEERLTNAGVARSATSYQHGFTERISAKQTFLPADLLSCKWGADTHGKEHGQNPARIQFQQAIPGLAAHEAGQILGVNGCGSGLQEDPSGSNGRSSPIRARLA